MAMTLRGVFSLLLVFHVLGSALYGESTQVRRRPASATTQKATPPKSLPGARGANENTDEHFFFLKLNTSSGINIAGGNSGVLMGGQVGMAPFWGVPLYLGPEVNFTYFNSTSLLMALGTAWYEFKIYGPHLNLAFGAQAGAAFNSGVPNLGGTSLAAFFDSALGLEVSDLAEIRGHFRPGIINGFLTFLATVDIQFRF
jgi:hypothetical protein